MNAQNGYNNNFFDLLNVASVLIGLQNLSENREQSAHNDVQRENDKQAKFLLEEINKRFEEQNQILAEQNVMLERILYLLERNGDAD